MDEGGEEEELLALLQAVDEFERSVGHPLRRVSLGGQLGDLRDVVHLAPYAVVVEDVLIGRREDELRVVVEGICHLLLRVALREAHRAVEIAGVVHLSDVAGAQAGGGQGAVEAVAGVFRLLVVRVASGACGIPARKQREPRGNADRRRGQAVVEDDRIGRQRVEVRCLDEFVSVCADRVVSELIGEEKEDVFHFLYLAS